MTSFDPARHSWPAADAGAALATFRVGMGRLTVPTRVDGKPLHQAIEQASTPLGLRTELARFETTDLRRSLLEKAPAIVPLQGDNGMRLVCVRSVGWRWIDLACPDGSTRAISAASTCGALRAVSNTLDPSDTVSRLASLAALDDSDREQVRRLWTQGSAGPGRIEGWSVRQSTAPPFWRELCDGGVRGHFAAFGVVQALHSAVWILSWWLFGQAAVRGPLETSWLLGWAIALVSLIPLRRASHHLKRGLTVFVGGVVRQRLFGEQLRLEPDEPRTQGVGSILGHALEADAVRELMQGVFLATAGAVQLLVAVAVLSRISWSAALLLVCTALGSAGAAWTLWRRRKSWATSLLTMTRELSEALVAHRTRLAQERRSEWHLREDALLVEYSELAARMDGSASWLTTILPRAWLLFGIAALLVMWGAGSDEPRYRLMAAVGAVLLAHGALRQLAGGTISITHALAASSRLGKLFSSASSAQADPAELSIPDGSDRERNGPEPETVLEARDLVFMHHGRSSPTLKALDLRIREGDRLLLEGRSGNGKSTLASVLAGMRRQQSGTLLVQGLDRGSLGERAWRRRVVLVPQFHDNHVLSGSLLFNLLMARRWPPRVEDVKAAREICGELGLGPLIDRMPGGLHQPVGETGWQLSHGERSRLFVARALLQDADVLIFDESFAALDSETLVTCVQCIKRRGPATLVIAHP